MVFGDFTFEEILLLLEVDGFGKPWEGVLGVTAGEWLEVAIDETAIGDVVDVLLELDNGESDRINREAVAE